jgi:hypothetical protein
MALGRLLEHTACGPAPREGAPNGPDFDAQAVRTT